MLYGKWRPRGFDEVVGQDHIVTTLRNALATGQLAHAYLFSGPRGTGKTTTARILARALNCLAPADGEPCGTCSACKAILAGNALDLIEMDAASNRGIDDIRELRDKIAFAPSDLKMKVYLLDEAHMLTEGAFNALLKTLEEPPPHAVFILATTESHKIPATIASRCQRYDFHRMNNGAAVERLRYICQQEGFVLPESGLQQIAVQSRGGMRDAITLLEQVVARYGATPSEEGVIEALGLVQDARSGALALALVERDLAGALDIAREVGDDGVNLPRFTRATVDILRDVLRCFLRGQSEPGWQWVHVLEAARSAAGVEALTDAIAALAATDFRLDPTSPIPLEVAIATAILAPPSAGVSATPSAPNAAGRPAPRPERAAASARPGTGTAAGPDESQSREERFMRELHEACRLANPRLGAWLNGSCKVVAMDGGVLELGFWNKLHCDKVDHDVRPLVEEQAGLLLKTPVQLKVTLLEGTQDTGKRPPRSGHLAAAAKALGAVPVQKDG